VLVYASKRLRAEQQPGGNPHRHPEQTPWKKGGKRLAWGHGDMRGKSKRSDGDNCYNGRIQSPQIITQAIIIEGEQNMEREKSTKPGLYAA